MISKLKIENFRSIESAEIDFGKITVLTGGNNAGKTSFLYALLAMRNIALNSNRGYDALFTFDNIANLGGFNDVVFGKDEQKKIGFEMVFDYGEIQKTINLKINPSESEIKIDYSGQNKIGFLDDEDMFFSKKIHFPYISNSRKDILTNMAMFDIVWSNIFNPMPAVTYTGFERVEDISIERILINTSFKSNYYEFIPPQRGFSKQVYNTVPLQRIKVTEDEIATSIALDRDLVGLISHYTEKILDRVFSVHNTFGTGFFYLQTRNRQTGFTADLVNEGTGTSQIISILARALQKGVSFIAIDEPEIHLHPSIISKLVDALVEIAEEQNKQFLISTHNEHFVTCLLTAVAEKKIKSEDLKMYHLSKPHSRTEVEAQTVNEHGQIAGGLKNFYESELENIAKLFNIIEP